MSNTAVALLIGGSVIAVGGVIAFIAIKKKKEGDAPVVAMPGGAGTPDVTGPAQKMSPGEALAIIGGKALQEGIKYAVMGQAGYAASLAGRAQKQG
jgi:hypothetical protein